MIKKGLDIMVGLWRLVWWVDKLGGEFDQRFREERS